MHLEGTQRIAAPTQRVWDALNDPDVLARCTPGVKALVQEGEDRYRGQIQLGIGPVRGVFEGCVEVRDKVPFEALTLLIEGRGLGGSVQAQGRLLLHEEASATEVRYSGDAKLFGPLAGLAERVMQGVAKALAGQFFSALEREVTKLSEG